jgi:VPDSG-CTERM motif
MKKILLVAVFVGLNSLVHATTINAPSSLVGANVLDGNNAYSWGIAIPVPSGQTVASAQIDFTGITLTVANSSGTGFLYTDLLNSQTGNNVVTTKSDGDAAGDYWATQFSGANITSLGTKFFASVGTTLTWSYVLNASQLAALNSYLAAGSFNIGIDPDCHYTVGGISFTYSLAPTTNSVPDVATTALLLLFGLAGLEVFRRQFVAVKAKA